MHLAPGTRCFIDANILTYFFQAGSPSTDVCDAFFQRLCAGEVRELIAQLVNYQMAATALSALPLEWISAEATFAQDIATVARECSLMTADAAIVALMRRHGLTDLVTNDDDFDQVPGIRIWKPRPVVS